MRNITIVAIVELLLCLAVPAYGQTPPHPWSPLTGPRPLGLPAAGHPEEQPWIPARVVVGVTPIPGHSVTTIDVARNPFLYEVNVWFDNKGTWCLLQTLLVDIRLGEQLFEIEPEKLKQGLMLKFEARSWYFISRVEGYDAAGKMQFPKLFDGVRNVNEKPPVPVAAFGPPAQEFAPSVPQWPACGGGPIVVVPPRRRPSKPPNPQPCPLECQCK